MIELPIPDKVTEIKKRNVALMYEDASIQAFLKEHHLGIEFIAQNYVAFMAYWQNSKICQNCKGLDHCLQDNKGQRMRLEYDLVLTTSLSNCPYKTALIAENRHLEEFVLNDIPKEYYQLTFDKAIKTCPDKNICIALGHILSGKSKRGIYLYGDFGVGKTYLIMALFNSLAMMGKKLAFVKVNKLIDTARNLTINDKAAYDELIASLMHVPYLALDDIGSEGVTAFSRDDVLFTVLDYRMENHLTTVFTSNADIEKLTNIYQFDKYAKEDAIKAKRLIERVVNLADPYCLKGNNRRRENIESW